MHTRFDNTATVEKKTREALEQGIVPIICVGENLTEREAGLTEQVIRDMLEESLKDFSKDELERIVIAYEPVWAIGTGKTATPEQADEACKFIKQVLDGIHKGLGSKIKTWYGGSVKPENARALAAQPHIDGFLIGGASLTAESFVAIDAESVETEFKTAPDEEYLAWLKEQGQGSLISSLADIDPALMTAL